MRFYFLPVCPNFMFNFLFNRVDAKVMVMAKVELMLFFELMMHFHLMMYKHVPPFRLKKNYAWLMFKIENTKLKILFVRE